jgi:uncharacterized membrane protein YdjX (TVP38/TMEM64 family)
LAEVKPERGRTALVKLILLGLVLVGGLLLARFTPLAGFLTSEGIQEGVSALRGSYLAPLVFMAIYATLTALAIPGTVLTLAGGALFGLFWGVIFNSIAANVGATMAFLLSRFLGREGVESIVGSRLQRLDDATREHGFRGLLILRLVPLVPFNALNFGSGLTAMRWRTYAAATVIGILPGTIVYTMFADALLQGSQDASREAFLRVLLAGVLLVLLSFLPLVMKKLKIRMPHLASMVLGTALMASSPAGAQNLPRHDAFSEVLSNVVEPPLVDYGRLQASREGLDRYLATLAATDGAALSGASRDAQLAFWLNAYNACMLRLVVDHYPIRKNEGFFDRLKNTFADRPDNSVWQIADVFTGEHCTIAGEPRSQDEIEHEIIRPMGDPRIHFAVNCAARGCPPLRAEAYTSDALDAQLDDNVRRFMRDPGHFELDREAGRMKLNRVLEWFGDDFGGGDGLRVFFSGYLEDDLRDFVLDTSTKIEFLDYDWVLNDVVR